MAVPEWVSYLSLAGGIVGTLSGCLAYRRTGQLKTLELRLELRKMDADVRNQVLALSAQLEYAKRSRERIAAATGGVNSGAMREWSSSLERDLSRLHELETGLPAADANYRGDSTAAIESMLVMRHKVVIEARGLSTKYAASVSQDDKGRESIRAALEHLRARDG